MAPSEVLDSALGVSRRLGGTLLRLTVAPSILCLTALVFVFNYALPQILYTQRPDSTAWQVGEALFSLSLALFVGGPLFLLGASYAVSVVVKLTSDSLLARPLDVLGAESVARQRLGSVFLGGLHELVVAFSGVLAGAGVLLLGGLLGSAGATDTGMAGVLAVIGICGVGLGGFALLVIVSRRALIAPIMLIEEIGLRAAVKRNKQLMGVAKYHPEGSGTIWQLYMVNFLAGGAIYGGVEAAILIAGLSDLVRGWTEGIQLQPLFLTAVSLLPVFFVTWMLLPFWAVVVTVLYYERRVRIEGFDIEQLNEEIGREGRTSRFNV